MYTVRTVPVPVPLRALTAGYQSARFSFMAELVFQLRKWLIMIAGISLPDAYWVLLACILMYGVIWFLIVRWKPFTLASQFDARLR